MSASESPRPPHLSPEEFRALGHRMVDWVADYWSRLEQFPVRSPLAPGEVSAMLPVSAPEEGLSRAGWEEVFTDLERIIVPGLTHWQSPSFFAYFPANASGPAVLGELLAAGLGVQGMLWSTSPACTELETRVLDWTAELLGLPEVFRSDRPGGGGVIQGTASESTFVAMVAARQRVLRRTPGAGRLVAYTTAQAHSSVLKAARMCGVVHEGDDGHGLRMVATGPEHAIDVAALERALREDLAAGRMPFSITVTLGTTSSGAMDDVAAVARVLRETGAAERGTWLHVDAAWAGSAFVCPELRAPLAGVEAADSFAFNPHKWLLTNFDCGVFYTRDRQALVDALSVTPEFLRNAASESGAVIDYRDWQVPLGRRFRALKLWLVLRHYGAEGLRAHIRHHLALAARFEAGLRADARFELAVPRSLALVCFRLRPLPGEAPSDTDARNRALLERVNATGQAFLSHTVLQDAEGRGRYVLRMAIGATRTEARHVDAALALLQREAAALR
jgi:aromatic-L-amino-acid/L-tryptophan decarboxylase